MRRRAATTALVLLVALGPACGGGSGDDAADRAPPSSGPRAAVNVPGVTSTFGPASTALATRFEFVDYVVSGGIAGVNDHLKVYPDGRATYQDGRRTVDFTVSTATVSELRAALQAADLPSLPPVNGSPSPDAMAHRVIFGGQAVTFYERAMPPSLGNAVAILNRELARAKAQR
jgi:hypothetical protein